MISNGAESQQPLSVECLPVVIVFAAEQREEMRDAILEGSRGIRIAESRGRPIAEQLA